MNTPNKLTLARVVMTPFFLLAAVLSFPHRDLVALLIFAAASVTDFIDGRLARKYNQITVFGQLLDPVADKMLTTAALLVFLQAGLCSIWAVMLILTREFAVTGLRLIASAQGVVLPANGWGKAKTAAQMISILLILLLCELQADGLLTALPTTLISNILIWITALLALISGVLYLRQGSRRITLTK